MRIIETHDIRKDIGCGFLAGTVILKVNVFAFEGAKETLHRSIVIAVACAAHAGLDLRVDEKSLVGFSSILAASIGILQCVCEGPANNFARE